MDEQQTKANLNVIRPAQLVAELLGFGQNIIVLIEAYFLAVTSWAYWSDWPTVNSQDFSGVVLSPIPKSMGATVAGFVWFIVRDPFTFADFVAGGRENDLDAATAALSVWHPELTEKIAEIMAILAPKVVPENAMGTPSPDTIATLDSLQKEAGLRASAVSAATSEPVPVDAPMPAPATQPHSIFLESAKNAGEAMFPPIDENKFKSFDPVAKVAQDAPNAEPATDAAPNRPHVVASSTDSFQSIGSRIGLSAEEVKTLNPDVVEVGPGTVIYLAP